MGYILRLLLKSQSEFTKDDRYMLKCYINKEIKWAPVKESLYLDLEDLTDSDLDESKNPINIYSGTHINF